MKKNINIKKIFNNFLCLLIFIPASASAQQYRVIESLPGAYGSGNSVSFPQLIGGIYQFAIWGIGIAALLMLMIGGFWYMTSAGNASQAGTAKKIIYDSILGIIVVLTSYLVLSVINGRLVDGPEASLSGMDVNITDINLEATLPSDTD